GAMASIVVGFLLVTGAGASLSSRSVVARSQAKAAANGCAQLALVAINTNGSAPNPLTSSQSLDASSGQSCQYVITGSSPQYNIAVSGTVTQGSRSYVHRLTLTTDQVSPQVNVSSWSDAP
ncbi:MAG: hypothetical protein ABI221_02690, partial [Candidatus Saccharimonadales bacterium]